MQQTTAFRIRSSLTPSWPQLAWFAGLCTLLSGSDLLFDPDTYWHIAAGRWILEHGRIPIQDPFSFSMPATAWTAHEWLSEVIFALTYAQAGWNGVVLLASASFAATLAIITRFLLRHLEPVHALLLVALSAGMMKSHLLARPHILVLPLIATWLIGLVLARERNTPPSPWLLPILCLWANLHGSFTLGIAFVGAMGLEALLAAERSKRLNQIRQWSAFFALSLLAAMLTPFHWEGIAFTAHVMNLKYALATIGEWRPPNFQAFNMFEVWLLMLLATALTGRLRLPFIRLLILAGFIHLSLKHGRYMAVTGLIAPILIAESFARHWYTAPKLGNDSTTLDLLFTQLKPPLRHHAILFSCALSLLIGAFTLNFAKFKPATSITPDTALEALLTTNTEQRLLNAYNFGGFLIFRNIPVFIDGRADMYGDTFLENYIDASNLKSAEALTNLLSEHKITATMLPPTTPAIALLDHLPGWKRLHSDDSTIVHIRAPD